MTIPARMMRTGLLVGEEGVKALQSSTVMIIGVGAVGGYALEAIARSGVGHIIVVDFDKFDETNINRQILALSSTIGRKKVDVALERIKEINPDCIVETIDLCIDAQNAKSLPFDKVDMVIDAIDTLNAKCSLIEELYQNNIPFISSMGAALRTDPSFIKIASLDKTKNCGLSKILRQRLRHKDINIKQIKCVYSDEPNNQQRKIASVDENGPKDKKTLGSLPTITAIFGLVIANEVIKKLLQKGA